MNAFMASKAYMISWYDVLESKNMEVQISNIFVIENTDIWSYWKLRKIVTCLYFYNNLPIGNTPTNTVKE